MSIGAEPLAVTDTLIFGSGPSVTEPFKTPCRPSLLSSAIFDDVSMLIFTAPTLMSLPPEMVAP